MTPRKILVALGANLPSAVGAPAETLSQALRLLNTSHFASKRISTFFRSAAFPAGSGPDYVNATASFVTDLAPEQVLAHLHDVEARLGRARHARWSARSIDLDLIAVGDVVLPDAATAQRWMALPVERLLTETPDRLILPHPRLQERAFVLVPLSEIAPDWVHPLTGLTAKEHRDALHPDEVAALTPLDRGE